MNATGDDVTVETTIDDVDSSTTINTNVVVNLIMATMTNPEPRGYFGPRKGRPFTTAVMRTPKRNMGRGRGPTSFTTTLEATDDYFPVFQSREGFGILDSVALTIEPKVALGERWGLQKAFGFLTCSEISVVPARFPRWHQWCHDAASSAVPWVEPIDAASTAASDTVSGQRPSPMGGVFGQLVHLTRAALEGLLGTPHFP